MPRKKITETELQKNKEKNEIKTSPKAEYKNMWGWYLHSIKNYNTFSGRASRPEYWYFILGNILITAILLQWDIFTEGLPFLNMYNILIFIPTIAVTFRRFHDVNLSGWWVSVPLMALFVVSFAASALKAYNQYKGILYDASMLYFISGIILIIYPIFVLIVASLKGSEKTNKYGKALR